MKKYKTLFVVLAGMILAGAVGCAVSASKRSLTGFFFGINTAPDLLNIKSNYPPRPADEKTEAIVAAANAFLDSLNGEQRQSATFAFSDNAQRANWSNLPEGMIPRSGIKLGELSGKQRGLLDALLLEIMSERGADNIQYQLIAEDTLPERIMSKYGSPHYAAAFLGEPSETQPWMFQFGGHHLAINVTFYGADAVFSPMLTGGQPVHLNIDGEDVFIIEEEVQAAQALIESLSARQKQAAVLGDTVQGLNFGPGEYGKPVPQDGIKGGDLSDEQQHLLEALIATRLNFFNEDDYAAAMETVRAELDDTYFGWWGPTDRAGFGYFRIAAPSLLIEYAPDDDDVESLTHVHSIYRNPKNDYGAAWLE